MEQIDFDAIKEDIKTVLRDSQNVDNPQIDIVFDLWKINKLPFAEQFLHGQLIYEFPEQVSYTLDKKDGDKLIDDFIDCVQLKYQNSALCEFIDENRQTFFKNIVSHKDESKNEICLGMKLIKAFKYFINNKDILHEIQDAASRIIQKNTLTGTLCVSIHPLDYLSLSQNNLNWRSCHALDGEYRAGNLSYMGDKSTIICYIKTDTDEVLPKFGGLTWNNTKWRMLLHFSDDKKMVFAGRQYPFSSKTALNFILHNVIDNVDNDVWGGWVDWRREWVNSVLRTGTSDIEYNYMLATKYFVFDSKLYDIHKYMTDLSKLHYNDILFSTVYKAYYSYDSSIENKFGCKPSHFTIGTDVPCIKCGEGVLESGGNSMCCLECNPSEETWVCEICGCYTDEPYTLSTGEIICEHCVDTECASCKHCNGLFALSDLYYDESDNTYICTACRRELKECE